MIPKEHLQKILEEHKKRAESYGFTLEYQNKKQKEQNVVCHRQIAPATQEKYDRAETNWALWRLSRNETPDVNLSKDDPALSPQLLKLFAENYIVTRKKIPSQRSVCGNMVGFLSKWEREMSQTLSSDVKEDVQNYIRTVLTQKYSLSTKPRERFLVTAKDLDYLLRHILGEDDHDYRHERARIQTATSLTLFSGSAARAGAIVESSSYRNTNECLYYKHLFFNLMWSGETGRLKRWVTIDPEFLKGTRYRDDKTRPKSWFREHPVLGKNFVFWVAVQGIADRAFKGISCVEELLAKRPPKGMQSWKLEWADDVENLPFFRMVTPQGPIDTALTFSSLHHHLHNLAQRDGFKDQLRVHGIRGAVANKIDPKASEATRGQALDHDNHNTYIKYQSSLKALDILALYCDLEPDYECRDMELSMSHHRDPNAPVHLDAASLADFENDEEVIGINQRIANLTQQISGKPDLHADLAAERTKLYTKKAKLLSARRSEFITRWWNACYNDYITGNKFTERDTTCLFDIYSKYMPERTRLRENIFQEVTLDSPVGRQCLQDAVKLCTSTERVAYYPEMAPVDGNCPICSKQMSSIALQYRAKHILQCRRKSLNAAPYQQRYKNGKRAHRRVHQNYVQFCYLCAQLICNETEWICHCQSHLDHLQPRCGLLTFRYTLVAAGLCPFCLGDETKTPDERFQQWMHKATLLNHIDTHMVTLTSQLPVTCPHPCCHDQHYDSVTSLRRHFFDAHSIEEPRSNCVSRKRRWVADDDRWILPESQGAIQDTDDGNKNNNRETGLLAHPEVIESGDVPIDPSLIHNGSSP